MELTDLEIFMKTIDDMYKSSKGYGNVNINIEGYFGIDMEQVDGSGSGVCLNMAENIARKLDAINKEYNARIYCVCTIAGEAERTIQKTNTNYDVQVEFNKFDITPIAIEQCFLGKETLGNHVVVAIDLKEDNITLIIDPTVCCIGVFKDGKITILNSFNKENPYGMYRTPLDDLGYRGIQSLQVPKEYIKSFLHPNTSLEEINKKYGIEAQKKALETARRKEEDYIYKQANKNNFKENLKVNLEESQIYSIDEIKELYKQSMLVIFNGVNEKETLINLVNVYRKINNSVEYYDEKQEEIIGKKVNDGGKISDTMKLNVLENSIINIMASLQKDIINLPKTDNKTLKRCICCAYLEAGDNEKIQDLKVLFKEAENNYYVFNDSTLLATIRTYDDGVLYIKENSKTQEEIKELLENAQPVIKEEKILDENNNDIGER